MGGRVPRPLPVVDPIGEPTEKFSGLSSDDLASLLDEIRRLYAADSRPWVIGYSGGKDSTCALQLIWTALAQAAPENLKKPVYILSSDTRVETPVIVRYIDATLQRINDAA